MSGGHPLRCATNANYPLGRPAAEEGLVRRRLSGRSPGISEDLIFGGKKKKKKEKNVKNLLFFKNHEKILKIKKINEGKKKEGSKKKKSGKIRKI